MNNQEAINILGQYDVSNIHFYTTDGEEIPFTEWSDAIEMAISALEKQEVKNSKKSSLTQKTLDTISRTEAISELMKWVEKEENKSWSSCMGLFHWTGIKAMLECLPSAQPEPLSDAYTKAVWTWLLDYQTKAAELKGRYTPYEVLSWVANDWRKEHEGSD